MKKTIQGFNVLDLENDPLAIRPGDYRDALDISLLSDGNGVTQSVEPVLGNVFTESCGEVNVQSKIIRIQLATGVGSYSLIFKRLNYIALGTATIAQNASAATTIANAIAAITGSIADATIITSSVTNLTVDVSILGGGPGDYDEWEVYNNSGTLAEFKTIQEAIDPGAAGTFKPIGSYDLLGDLFKLSATVADIPSVLPVTAVTNLGGAVRLTVADHGIIDGSSVIVQGITDNSGNSLNGSWIATLINNGFGEFDADSFVLVGSTYDAPYALGTAQVTINPYSIGRVQVSEEDVIADVINTTVLLTSKQLNFRVKRQPDIYIENNSQYIGIYFTDNFNPIRVLYYYGPYVTNGFLNTYSYGTIDAQSRLLLQDTNITLAYNSTITGVGQLKSGDYRYAVRFVTANESATSWTQLSNVINIYAGSLLVGDVDGTITSRANVFDVTGIPTGLFKYIELAYVIYQGEANASFLASRTVITSSSMQLTHTGFGTEVEVDLGTLQSVYAGYETAKSIDVLNNKMIISNLSANQIRDFSLFAQSLTHELVQETIPSVGISVSTAFDNYTYGEYFNPETTYNKKTFVYNETYRFALSVKLRNGPLLSNQFWIDDIRFDTNANNNLADPTSNRRTGGLPDYKLVDAGTGDVFVASVIFGNIDWNFTVDGIRIIDLVERIYINQVEMTSQYKEILGTGLCVNFGRASEDAYTTGNNFTTVPGLDHANCQLPEGWSNPNLVGEFNWFSGNTELVNGTLPNQFPNTYTDARIDKSKGIKYASFYSPDDYFNNESFDYRSGDKLFQFSEVHRTVIPTNQTFQGYGLNAFKGEYQELIGSTGSTDPLGTGAEITLDDVQVVSEGGTLAFGAAGVSAVKTSYMSWQDSNLINYNSTWKCPASPVLYAQSGFNSSSMGLTFAQYYRPKSFYVKFGPKSESKYVPTGTYIDAPLIGVVASVQVYGDSFTQSSFYKLRAPEVGSTAFDGVLNHFYKNGWGFETMFYSQNRVNSQMRYPISGNAIDICPYISVDNWNNSANLDIATTLYTPSYTVRNQVNVLPAYDPNALDTTKFPTRIAYSQTKPNGSITDEYRNFKPLDFRDLDMVAGEIIHHEISNGELLTWQQRSFQRQYFNDTGALVSADGSEVILGDGGALSRRGIQLSSLGTTHKWSIVKGVSKGGNDVMAWWNTEYGYVIRFGYDGVNPISYVHNINGFVDKNTKWVDLRHTPADDEGIRGVWNDERKEYIWTIRGFKTNRERFNPRKYYAAGDSVWVYEGFQQTPTIYKALQQTSQVQGGVPIAVGVDNVAYWQLQDSPVNKNAYTLAFSEFKNGFSCYYSFLPLFYAKWKKSYESSSPFIQQNIYIHNRGAYSRWYGGFLISKPFIMAVLNDNPNDKKSYNALELNSLLEPNSNGHALDLFTEQHVSYLDASDFSPDELHDIMRASWIKNDATVTAENPNGLNDVDTSELFGEYLLLKFYFTPEVYNKLFAMTVSYQMRSRMNNT